MTRADLAEHMGVSTTMIGEWIADLVHARLIEEAGKAKSRGGRPALNAFPLRYCEPGTRRVAHPNVAPRRRVAPLR